MDFGEAIRALKAGARVSRAGWNGKGMWIALTPGSAFEARYAKCGHAAAKRADELGDPEAEIELLPHIDMRAADGSMVIGWLASQTDMLAEDWISVEPAPKVDAADAATAMVEKDAIVIRLPLSNLQIAALGGWAAGYLPAVRIDNQEAFAKAMVRALNQESEDGTTPIHRLLDEAVESALEDGAGEEIDDECAERLLADLRGAVEG